MIVQLTDSSGDIIYVNTHYIIKVEPYHFDNGVKIADKYNIFHTGDNVGLIMSSIQFINKTDANSQLSKLISQ